MARAKVRICLLAGAVCLGVAPSALTSVSAFAAPVSVPAMGGATAPRPPAAPVFHPRVGPALGLFPALTSRGGKLRFAAQPASQPLTPVTYHGGQTMTGGVTVHTIFWNGGTNPFQGQPPGAPHDYIGMLQQYLTDVAAASTGTSGQACALTQCNVFSVEPQYGWGTTPGGITPGSNDIHYSLSDSLLDTTPYPAKSAQCASPNDTPVCLTDAEVQAEVSRVIDTTHGSRGLHDLWYVFTPPGVDECISAGVCESNAFGGYHSVSDLGSGPAIYAYTGDPIVESRGVNTPGADPEGYPDAEIVIDIIAHETNEAMTDPEGVGYMDPNGFEVGDKCENGPQLGTPLGFAADGSPFNQVVNGHQYLLQEMWANSDNGGNPDCVQATSSTASPLPLPQVHLTQFSSTVTGNIEHATAGVAVKVTLQRAGASGTGVTVATGSTTTAADGTWSVSLGSHAVGDDRDVITVDYAGAGAPTPSSEQILTGSGGNPFTESGWTGWLAMDNGSALTNSQTVQGRTPPTITLEPCFQTGLESYSVAGVAGAESPTDFCDTTTDAATAPLAAPVKAGQAVTWSSLDDRAFTPPGAPNANLTGALVSLTVPGGEPDSVSSLVNPLLGLPSGGFPTCTGDLQAKLVTCTGLVPGEVYKLTGGGANASFRADATGTVSAALPIKGGDLVKISNGTRVLTTLHVAHLRAVITGNSTVLSGGRCQPGEYYGPPLSSPVTSPSAGSLTGGAALTGEICPLNGSAAGLPSPTIAQTDDFSGGQTTTEVPLFGTMSPPDGENVSGTFAAQAAAVLPGAVNPALARIALKIIRSGITVFSSRNVDVPNGVKVSGLKPGQYSAVWTLTDRNGDVRVLTTEFLEG